MRITSEIRYQVTLASSQDGCEIVLPQVNPEQALREPNKSNNIVLYYEMSNRIIIPLPNGDTVNIALY